MLSSENLKTKMRNEYPQLHERKLNWQGSNIAMGRKRSISEADTGWRLFGTEVAGRVYRHRCEYRGHNAVTTASSLGLTFAVRVFILPRCVYDSAGNSIKIALNVL